MKLKIICRCSLFSSWSGKGLISTHVCRGQNESFQDWGVCYLIFGNNLYVSVYQNFQCMVLSASMILVLVLWQTFQEVIFLCRQ
jgi:hypothetical protein